jgi:hypothetical protein
LDAKTRERGVDKDRLLDFHSPYDCSKDGCSKDAANQHVANYERGFEWKISEMILPFTNQ